MSTWVSVKEKLPDDGLAKLVYRSGENVFAVMFYIGRKWIDMYSIINDIDPIYGYDVVCWMDIPLLPEDFLHKDGSVGNEILSGKTFSYD